MIITSNILKVLRLETGLTQKQLANLVGVTQAHIAKIEGGKVNPRLSTVNRILQVLVEEEGRKCREIMTEKVIFADSMDKISHISRIMMENAISQLPVMENGKVVGTITEESIIRNLSSKISEKIVKEIMAPALPIVSENTSLNLIRQLLGEYVSVLVVRKGQIVGIITRSDLLKTVSKMTPHFNLKCKKG